MKFSLSSIRWTAGGAAISKVSALLRLLAITSAIGVYDMGVYAAAAAIAAAANSFAQGGFRQLYLSHQGDRIVPDSASLLSTTWTGIALSRALIIGPTLLLSWAVSRFFNGPSHELIGITMLLALSTLTSSLQSPGLLAAERNGNFSASVKSESLGQIVSLIVILSVVLTSPSVWLMPIGQLISTTVCSAASYIIAPRSIPPAKWPDLKALAIKGKPFSIIAISTYVTYNLDKLLIGILLSPAAAGIYFVAQRLADAPGDLYTSIIGRTVLPHYAKIHKSGHPLILNRVAGRYLAWTALLFTSLALAYTAIPALIPSTWLREGWSESLSLAPLLMLAVGMRVGCHVISPALAVIGFANVDAKLKVVEAIAYLPLIPIAIRLGGEWGVAILFTSLYAASLFRRVKVLHGFS